MNDHQSVTELLAAGRAASPTVNIPGLQAGVILPEGYAFRDIPFVEPEPLLPFIQQQVQLSDTESFVAYIKRYQDAKTVIFATLPQSADGSGAEFRAVFDYHVGGKGEDKAANRCAHQAFFPCPLSVNWKAWIAVSGKPQTQDQFINFIEANTPDIVTPDSAALMEMALNFESRTEVEFTSKVDRLTGARKLTFNETIGDTKKPGGSITVPDSLKLKLPVFEGGKPFDTTCRLEWRPQGGKLHVVIRLLHPHDVIRTALTEIRKEIAADVAIEPMTGRLA
jgi:uncharacterized protein YfdQ (DUF2303 family)